MRFLWRDKIWRFVGTSNSSELRKSIQRISILVRGSPHPSLLCMNKGCGFSSVDFRRYSVSRFKDGVSPVILNRDVGIEEENAFSGISISDMSRVTQEETAKNLIQNEDVSPYVHRITRILREKNPVFPVEEFLENCGLSFTPEIVEKVLKRCFKMAHLALRFFNWVKLQPGFKHTSDTYNAMIYIAGEAKDFTCMKRLLEEMDRESCPKTIKTWTIVISQYGKANLIKEALQAFAELESSNYRPDKTAYNSIIYVLCKARSIELATKLHKQMLSQKMTPELPTYRLLMNCFCEKRDLLKARALGDEMLKIAHVPKPIVYSFLLKSFCIVGRIEEALELIHEIKERSLMPESEIFSTLVKGLCRTGKMQDAMQLVDVMKRQNCIPDENIYGILINGYLKAGQLENAFEMLNIMKKVGSIPTVSSYTALIQHLFRLNEFEKAFRLFEEMRELGREPDVVSSTAMIAGQVSQGHIFEAWEIFNTMKNKGMNPTWKTYSVFIKELCKASRSEEACKLLYEMKDRSINPGARIFQWVVSSLEKEGKKERAEEVMNMNKCFKLFWQEKEVETRIDKIDIMRHCQIDHAINVDNQRLDTDGHVLLIKNEKQMLSNSDFEAQCILERDYADSDFQQICGILLNSEDQCSMEKALRESEVGFTPSLVNAVLQNCQKHGNVALRFFSWVGQQSGYSHTTDTFNMAIKIAGSAKDFKHMRVLLEDMRREGCLVTANTWTIIVTQYGRAGLTNAALKKFEEMKGDKCRPNANTYKYLIMFLCGKKGRNLEAAIEIFQEMLCAGFMPDKSLSGLFLTSLCDDGKLLEARKFADNLQKRRCFTDQIIYSMLVRGFCRAGKMAEALDLADEMKNQGCAIDEYIYGSLVHGLLRVGQLSKALEMLECMKQGGYSPTVHIYTALIIHFFREKKSKQAFWVFDKMKKDGCEPTVITYSALIRGYMNEGLLCKAWDTFNFMKDKGPAPDFETYSTFMHCLCRDGKSEVALELLYDMVETGIHPSARNFQTVFFGLNREGKRHEAWDVLRTKRALSRRRRA
eukprot:Gb_04017 [translate_table: standard]